MERMVVVDKTDRYLLEWDREDDELLLHVTNPALARRLRGSFFFSRDGKRFVNAAGGMSKSFKTLKRTLRFTR